MSASSNSTTDEAVIRELVENWARAVRARDSRRDSCQSLYGHVDV
jgi:hypothetical protein